MYSWARPFIPRVLGEAVPLRLYDTADQAIRPVTPGPVAGMYVCGITPYDATHLGHAATYIAFDLINRQLRDNGHEVRFIQNVTDVDDPLFERAERDNVDWKQLGYEQIQLFRSDMENLRVISPDEYVSVSETVDEVIEFVSELLRNGSAYRIDDAEYPDIYASIDATEQFGYVSNCSESDMCEIFAERGGDPDRPGKRHPLDALLWRMTRPGEPCWDSPLGAGRPGWHIECAAIANNRLRGIFDIQGGGSDLAFPHHEFSAAHVEALTGDKRMAGHYVHTGMIALDGVKMSKSLGNLVFVSKLTAAGHDPAAIRLGIYASHYRSDRSWSDDVLRAAEERLARYRDAVAVASDADDAQRLVTEMRKLLAHDLNTPAVLDAADRWATRQLEESSASPRSEETPRKDAGTLVALAFDGLMGVHV